MVSMNEKRQLLQQKAAAAQAEAVQAPLKRAWNEERLRLRDECAADACNAQKPAQQYRPHGIIKKAFQQIGMRTSSREGGIDGTKRMSIVFDVLLCRCEEMQTDNMLHTCFTFIHIHRINN